MKRSRGLPHAKEGNTMLRSISTFNLAVFLLLSFTSPGLAASAPQILDFPHLPDEIFTNLDTFLVAGSVEPGEEVRVNGTAVSIDGADFAAPVHLAVGANNVDVLFLSPTGQREFHKSIVRDPGFDTSAHRLVYVDVEADELSGTVVLDLTEETLLGFISGRHVRGSSPDGHEVYFADRTVLSGSTHASLKPLQFKQPILVNGFLVAPDGSRLFSRNQVLDTRSRKVVRQMRDSLQTGSSWSGAPIPGGPAMSPDGRRIFYGSPIKVLDTHTFSRSVTRLNPYFLSDLAITADGRYLLISEYSSAVGSLLVYDAETLASVATVSGLGDFAGEIAFSKDGSKIITGSDGNPASPTDGQLTVIDATTFEKLSQTPVELANNLVMTDYDEILVGAGDRAGLDVYALGGDGKLTLEKTFILGIHRYVPSFGQPQRDDIRTIVYKPSNS